MLKEQILGSSVNSSTLSLTIKGLLLGVIPVVVGVVRLVYGIDLPESLLNGIVDNVVLAVQQATILISVVTVVVGLVRKLIVLIRK